MPPPADHVPGAACDSLRTPSCAWSLRTLYHPCEAGREGGSNFRHRMSLCGHPVRPGAQTQLCPASSFPFLPQSWAASQNQGVSTGEEPVSKGRTDGLYLSPDSPRHYLEASSSDVTAAPVQRQLPLFRGWVGVRAAWGIPLVTAQHPFALTRQQMPQTHCKPDSSSAECV